MRIYSNCGFVLAGSGNSSPYSYNARSDCLLDLVGCGDCFYFSGETGSSCERQDMYIKTAQKVPAFKIEFCVALQSYPANLLVHLDACVCRMIVGIVSVLAFTAVQLRQRIA